MYSKLGLYLPILYLPIPALVSLYLCLLVLVNMEAAPVSEPRPSLLTSLFLTLISLCLCLLVLANMEAAPVSEPRPSLLTLSFPDLDFPVPLPPVPGLHGGLL